MSNIENTNTTEDRMGLVRALQILHVYQDMDRKDNGDCALLADALEVIFEWIDNMVLLLNKPGGKIDGFE